MIVEASRQNLTNELRIGRNNAFSLAQREKAFRGSIHFVWTTYGEGRDNYELTFKNVLLGDTLRSIVERAKSEGKKAFAMDLMGPGNVLGELPIDGGVAITLSDLRNPIRKLLDKGRNISTIPGDILQKDTWRKIDTWITNQSADGFHLVLCRPLGGFADMPQNFSIYFMLLNQAWKVLSRDYGTLFTQVPTQIPLGLIQGFAQYLNSQSKDQELVFPGSNSFFSTLRFIKSPTAPETLPCPKSLDDLLYNS